MIFKTITDEATLSGQRIVGALQARKIAQQQATAQLEIDIACLKEYQVACQSGTVTTKQFDTIMHKASTSAVEYSAKIKAGTGTTQSYANAQRATNSALREVSIGVGIASKAVKLFSTALNMIAFTAIIQSISWLIGKVDEWIVTAKEAKESANAFKESLSTFFSETQSNLKTISSLSDRFDELSKNVDDNGKKIGGTEEEYAEFLDICQQVGQIMPGLITGYTNEGEAIITLQGKVDSLTDSYKEAIKAKASLFISKGDEEGNTIDSFFEDYNNFIKGTQEKWYSFSPSPQFSKTSSYEEYYGYDQIYKWLSNVKDKSLEELNLQIKSTTGQIQNVYLRKILEEADFDINNITEENYNAIHDVFNNKFTVMEKELSDRVLNIKSAFQNMLYADSDYWNIDDENVISAINSLYSSIDAEFIKENQLFSQKALQTFQSDFVSLFNNDATKQAMVDFYTPIADDETVQEYTSRIKSSLETLQAYCNENSVSVPINFGNSKQTINDLEAQYQRAVDFAKDKFGESIEIETQALKDAKQNLEDEYQKASELGFDNDYIEWLKNDTIRTVFGNVDMDKRTIITWSDELKQTYADALASWNYNPEIGGIDAVFGDSGRFGEQLNGTGWEVAFTPILSDGTLLSSDTVYEYIENIVAEAYSLNGEVTQDNLKAIDAQGQQIGNTFVHGIFAAVDDSLDYDNNGNLAETVGRLMNFTGDFGAVKLAKQEIEDARKVINWDSWFNENVKSPEEIEIFHKIVQEASSATDAIKKYNTAKNDINTENFSPLSITDTIDQLNTQLKPTFDSIKSAYEDIFTTDDNGKSLFTLENVDLSMLDSIKSAIDELNENKELGINIDYASFENLAKVFTDTASTANDVHNAFNAFATDIVNSLNPNLSETSGESLQLVTTLLQSLGVINAEEVVISSLGYSYQQYTAAKEECTNTSLDLQTATQEEINAFVNEQIAAGTLGQALAQLEFNKVLVSNTHVETQDDINRIFSLAEAAGIGSEALAKLAQFKTDLQNETDPKTRQWIVKSINEYTKTLAQEIKGAQVEYKAPTTKSKKSGSKSQKDTTKEFDWIEQAIENAEKEVKKLEDIVNSAYTTFFEKNQALVQEIGKVNEEIGLQQQAYDEYMRKAESTKLSEDYKALVRDGAIQIDDISDENLQNAITDYQKWYDKAVSVSDKITELQEKVKDLNAKDYEQQSDSLQRSQEKNLITMADYYRSMMALQDKYYNNEATKLKDLANKIQTVYGDRNSLKLTRNSVDASTIQAAGYNTPLQSSSIYAQSFGNETKQVVVTPILPDGTILSPNALTEYANKLLNGEQIDADIELAVFEGNDATIQTANYINGLEMMQAEYQNLKKTFSENLYDNFTEKQLEAIEKLTEEIEKHKSQLSSELGDIKSAYDDLQEIRDTYNKYGKISVDQYQSLCDMGFEYLALLSNESGALSLDEDAFQRLTDAKIQQIQVDMALQAADLIKNIQTEEQAVQYLAASYENLASNALSAAEQMLYAAKANAQLMYGVDSLQAKAANTIVQGYENSKLLAGNIDIKMKSGGGYEEKEEKADETDWGEKILDSVERGLEKTERTVEKISDKTDKLIDKVDKFFSWQKKNRMINRAVKSSDKEIQANEKEISKLLSAAKRVKSVSNLYSQKLNSIDLSSEYKNKIENGTLEIESISDESLKNTISEYEKWYDKLNNCKDKMEEYNDAIQECRDSVSELYEQQRDLIKQKLENVLSYYSDMDSYLSSITSKIESLISLNDEMGKRSSLTELVEQFASLSDQIQSTTQKEITSGVIVTEGSLGDSKKVADAVNCDRKEIADSIQKEIDNLNVDQSGTYTKLLKDIAKTEAQIDKYIDKGWDVKKAKQFEKLTQKLQNYYDLQNELDQNATSNTVGNYSRIYTAYQKLQNKLNSGKPLSKSEQKKFDSYEKQLEELKNKGQASLDKLYGQLAEANGTAPKKSEADKIKDKISTIHSGVKNSATYQNLLKDIEKVENKLTKLDKKGYDNLSKSQKKTYDKLQSQLEGYYEQKESLDQNATAANIAEYNKIYLAWKKLQDKLDKGGNLSVNDWKKYNSYTEQLENYATEKAEILDKLNDDLAEALDPSDKLETIQKTYEESAEGIYESYQNQIDGINGEAINTQQYQNLYAKAQKLEQKKDTKGLSKSEQAQLDKYNAELEALQKGATGTNISEYIKTWESWYKLQQKLDKGTKLSANEAKKYDTYKAQLEAWNNEKQTQISDLLSQMEDDLAQLQKTHTENVSEAESQVSDYYANLYQLAKQIAEYNVTTLKTQLEYLDSMIGYYKELVSLYDTFSGEKLTKLLTDLDENTVKTKVEVYSGYLDTLQDKYNTTLSEMNEYQQLLDALDTNDFQSSMDLFDKAMESYKASGDIVMADKLQSVLDLLNERAVDADNWGEFADKWAEEWKKEFASAKQELIGTANEIQNVNDALRNAKFENITNAINELDTAKGILSSITNLIQDEWLYDQGELSEYGQAKVALLVSQLEDAQKKANAYLDLYNEIQNNKDTYASDKAYMEDLNNAVQNYYNTLGEAATLENSIVELMKRSAQEELNNLKSIIEARKKALQKKKEYYDYDKNLKNKQKEIDSIKAQIAAIENLSGEMDAATKAKLAQLKADLAEKEDSLQETKEDHTYNLQIDALDEFAASLEDVLDNSTKSLAEILSEYQKAINDATDIYKTSIDSVNGTLDKMKELYGGTGTITGGANIDLTPKGTENTKPNNTIPSINVVPSTDSSETPNAIKGDEEDVNLIIKQNMMKAAELFEKYGAELTNPERIFKVNDQQMFDLVNRQFSSMNANYNIPDYIKNKNEQTNITIHYDNMINVEGSVDKSFGVQFKKDTDELYKDFKSRFSKDLQLHGVNFVQRPTLR